MLCGVFDADELVAVGGLNIDPYVGSPEVGRLRRIYVRAAWRGRGIGSMLISALLQHARATFREVRLRAENADAARLYERIGFERIDSPDATHETRL